MISRAFPWALCGAMALALASIHSVGRAQSASDTSVKPQDDKDEELLTLSPFEVAATNEEDGYLAKSSASASRVAVNYLDLSQTVSVITSQFISDYNIQDTRKLFEQMPNVFTGSTDQSNRLWIRGSEVGSIYIDGVGGTQQAGMPLQFYDRVELVSGLSSSAFGVG
jgi:outer membrane receptor for ferric coprogen and ferric-rhodotorulic acid